jgi:uncharacterized protein (TIGR02118 family)
MIKVIILLKRKDGLTHEEFVDHWHDTHTDLASQLPDLLHYSTLVPRDPERTAYDGFAELYFESEAAATAAFRSDIGWENREDAEEFIDTEEMSIVYTDEHVHVDGLDR